MSSLTVSGLSDLQRAGVSRALLRDLFPERLRCAPGEEVVAAEELTDRIFLVRRGWLIQYVLLADGRRQVLRILLPGDLFGLARSLSAGTPYSVTAITAAQLLAAPVAGLPTLFQGHSELALALFRALAMQFSAYVGQHVALGRLTAEERMAWLLLHLHDRLAAVGQVRADGFPLPLTQEVLADALGLSTVHINRTLKKLRSDGLIEQSPGTIRLLARDRLGSLAQLSHDDGRAG